MFEDVPRGIGDVDWLGIEMLCWKIGDGLLKGHMGIAPNQEGKQLFSDDLIRRHEGTPLE
jgi:hypothetical protein